MCMLQEHLEKGGSKYGLPLKDITAEAGKKESRQERVVRASGNPPEAHQGSGGHRGGLYRRKGSGTENKKIVSPGSGGFILK